MAVGRYTHVARGRLNETTVRDSALISLAAHYNAREDIGKVANQAGALTRRDAERSLRADGIVACRMKAGGVLCAAVEAKSYRMRGRARAKRIAYAAAVAVLASAIAYLVTRSVVSFGLAVPAFLAARASFARLMKESAVSRITAYPAHERWVALPVDLLNTRYAEDVRSECRAMGIGVLRIGRSRTSTILDMPRLVKQPEDGVLARYRCAPRVLERLA